jgi:hypothetical protein
MPLQRDQLPQIPDNALGEFKKFVQQMGATVEDCMMPVTSLKAIQAHVNPDKVASLKEKYRKDGALPPVQIANDGYILDGHHRWLAIKEVDPSAEIACVWYHCPITDLVRWGHEFDKSFVKTVYECTNYRVLANVLFFNGCI